MTSSLEASWFLLVCGGDQSVLVDDCKRTLIYTKAGLHRQLVCPLVGARLELVGDWFLRVADQSPTSGRLVADIILILRYSGQSVTSVAD